MLTKQLQSPVALPTLIETIGLSFILAYRESTALLEQTLSQQGFACEVIRQVDRPEYQTYASIYRCMLNHHQAWLRAAEATQPTLILEADFVPVVGFRQLPLPFDLNQPDVGVTWLYTCAPQLYSVTTTGFCEGYSTGLVAYILTPQAAQLLSSFVEVITRSHGTTYYNFDSDIDQFLRSQGCKNYIAFRNYGEHGGTPNPEHQKHGMSGIHRADVLYQPLAFAPAYAANQPQPNWRSLAVRLQARLKGLIRLLSGRFLRLYVLRHSSFPVRLLRVAIQRQLTWIL